jgi:hypothetical protein
MEKCSVTCKLRLTCVAALLATLGCGGGGEFEVAPVRGVVTVDGKPLAGGRLMFAPVASAGLKAGKTGFADIQADGTYAVSTYGSEDGAVVADHWVTVLSTGSDAAKTQLRGAARVTYPTRQTIRSGEENVIDLPLDAAMIKRFGEGADD